MADNRTAWGIDIGQAGLKAIKLRSEGDSVRAVAFDYIAHPKILSQPDAVPGELISQAVDTFFERNKVGNDLIGISVGGQSSLVKFIKLPPVEPSKVAEIVKYEAKQQIPFDLEDVVWDFQTIGGGVEESGFMLEAEVGLFAMKRDLVDEAMEPITSRKKEIELVQAAPLALYNYLSFDVLGFRKDGEEEPPDAEDYYIILDKGCDNTTLLVSNGRNIWIRNVPIGGNHFTRALTREMKLTFAKAEHLKCNATKAPDPKAVFQAMRPVFSDYVTEIQRSIGYFGSVNRNAKIKRVIGVGNGFKMAGLQKFLQQNLQYEVKRLDELDGVTGDGVLSDPLFIDNMMTFAVPYGLALQTLNQTRIRTTLLPPEIVVDRKIRAKKPWAVAMAAGLLLTMGIGTAMSARVAASYDQENDPRLKEAIGKVSQLSSEISSGESAYGAQKTAFENQKTKIDSLTAPLRKREIWLELLKAVNDCLPRDTGDALDEQDITLQNQLRIDSFTHKRVADIAEWHTALAEHKVSVEFLGDDKETAPESAPGYIVTLQGHHYFNNDDVHNFRELGINYVKSTICTELRKWTVTDPDGRETPVGKLGISHPICVQCDPEKIMWDPDARIGGPGATGGGGAGMGMPGGGGGGRGGGMSGGMPGGGMSGGMPGGGMSGGMPGGGGRGGGMSGGMPGGGMSGGMPGGGRGGGRGGGMGGGEPPGGPGAGTGRSTPQASGTPIDSIDESESRAKMVTRSNFIVQFAWVPTPADERKDAPDTDGMDASEDGTE